jgi:outer membrane protein W
MASSGGTAADGLSLSDTIGDQAALGLELGLRATPNLYLGLLLEGGVGDGGHGGCVSADCSTSSATGRLGLQLRYHLAPFAAIDPWLGYGVAVSTAHQRGSDAAGTFSRTFTGVEWAKLSVGADLRLARTTSIGLFAEWTRGTFTHLDDRQDGVLVASGELARTTDHSWFMIGPRLTF